MFPRPFEYASPASLDEALAHLASVPGSRVLAGGMSLLPMMKLRVVGPPMLVDIAAIPGLGDVAVGDEGAAIGPNASQRDVACHPVLNGRATALAEAASWTGDPQVRNRGTLCGSLAHADPSADQPAAMLVLGGVLELRSSRGDRTMPIDDFFRDAFTTAMEPDEMLTSVTVPLATKSEGSAYQKLGRRGGRSGFAIAGSAARVRLHDGIVSDASVALTAVSHRPVLAPGVADALVGSDGSAGAIRSAAARAADDIAIVPDLHGSAAYKAHLARVLTERSLTTAIHRARQSREVA